MTGYENKNKNDGNTAHDGVSDIYPGVPVPDWRLQLTTTAQPHKWLLYCLSLAVEKIKIQILRYSFFWMRIVFAPS